MRGMGDLIPDSGLWIPDLASPWLGRACDEFWRLFSPMQGQGVRKGGTASAPIISHCLHAPSTLHARLSNPESRAPRTRG